MLKAGLPATIVNIIHNWYNKLFVSVRWNGVYSNPFRVGSGVRQGSTLSPTLFNMFMNIFILKLKGAGIGCHIMNMFCGCFLYADDIIILSPSVCGLQRMLDVCFNTGNLLYLKFNCDKSHCIFFGKCSKMCPEPMYLGTNTIQWTDSIKYLGIHVISGKCMSFDIDPIKRSFYAACNSITVRAQHLDEIVHLSLQESYCLPILTYATAAMSLTKKQLQELNVCWNSIYRSIFHFNRWESVKVFIQGLGRLDLVHILEVSRIKYYHHVLQGRNTVLYNLLWKYCADNFLYDACLGSIFVTKNAAISSCYNDFAIICSTTI